MKNLKTRLKSGLFIVTALTLIGFVIPPNAGATAGITLHNSTTGTSASGLYWNGIATSSDGTHMAATVNNGDIWLSTDSGAHWTDNTASGTRDWSGIASSANGAKLAATTASGDVWTSTNSGASWTDHTTGGSSFIAITSSADGTNLAAIGSEGDIYTSTDSGSTWVSNSNGASGNSQQYWMGIASSSDGLKLEAVGIDQGCGCGPYTISLASTDAGANWADVTTQYGDTGMPGFDSIASSSDGTHLAVTDGASVYTSVDSGLTWKNATQGSAAANHNFSTIVSSGDGTKLAASVSGNGVWTSSDSGATWTNSFPSTQSWSAMAYSTDGTTLAATTIGSDIWTSVDPLSNPPTQGGSSTPGIPNSGDANNDGTQDSTQAFIAGMTNPVTGKYALVQAGSGCTVTNQSIETEASQSAQDNGYNYPAGLMNFTVNSCGAPGFTTTVTQYYYGLTGNNFVLRKYNATTKTYATVPNATITHVTIGGQDVTKVTYNVTDGGSLDQDGTVNGVIVDPAGLAVPNAASTPDTSFGGSNPTSWLPIAIGAFALLCLGAGLPLLHKNRSK